MLLVKKMSRNYLKKKFQIPKSINSLQSSHFQLLKVQIFLSNKLYPHLIPKYKMLMLNALFNNLEIFILVTLIIYVALLLITYKIL